MNLCKTCGLFCTTFVSDNANEFCLGLVEFQSVHNLLCIGHLGNNTWRNKRAEIKRIIPYLQELVKVFHLGVGWNEPFQALHGITWSFSDFSDFSDFSALSDLPDLSDFSDFSDLSDFTDLFTDFSDFSDDFSSDFSDEPALGEPEDPSSFIPDYGSDREFDDLADSCFAGDLADCDELYRVTPIDASTNSYEGYGATCGGRLSEERPGQCEFLS